jgi:polyisoprenoid-binding protein YceI
MKYGIIISTTAFALTACYTPPDIALTAAPAGDYTLDPAHASVVWSLSHAGLSQYTARFDDISGALSFDPVKPENSRVDIRIDPKSVSTGDAQFDETIADGGNYFDSGSYPEIRFVSTDIRTTGENTGLITGDLTFRGVTLPLTLTTTYNGAGSSFGNPGKTLGFSATGTLKRSDFGLSYLTNLGIGDDVSLVIEAEFNEARR